MKNLQAMLLCDYYKISHRNQYPPKTEKILSTWTPRATRMQGINEVVAFGAQGAIQHYLIDFFNEFFFGVPLKKIVADYKRIISCTLGVKDPDVGHIEVLHKLGYLPLEIKSVAEGTRVPLRCPMLTIENTHPDFFWLTNFIESFLSNELWKPSTSATIAYTYRKMLDKYAAETGGSSEFVQFQGHDFSFRGMGGLGVAMSSGAGHLLSFVGTDTIPAILWLEEFYGANVEKELVGCSVPATEHSIQCAYGNDQKYFENMLSLHPTGIISIVSDGYDFWDVVQNVLPKLKDNIMARDGKLVIRPDSGDPVKILVGDTAGATEAERKGLIECLWDTFGGTINKKGYKELDGHIGAIYGDSITIPRCDAICAGLAEKEKKFASTNVVFGIGSYTYAYNTRDTFGFALKSTLCVIDGDEKMIYKDPKTDTDKIKKSQKGAVVVYKDDSGNICYKDGLTLKEANEYKGNMLETVFLNGKMVKEVSLAEVRKNLLG